MSNAQDLAAALMPRLRLYRAAIEDRISCLQRDKSDDGAREAAAWGVVLGMHREMLGRIAAAASVEVTGTVLLSSTDLLSTIACAIEYGRVVGTLAGDDMSPIRSGGAKGGKGGLLARHAKTEAAKTAARPLILSVAAGGQKALERVATDALALWKDDDEPSLSTMKKWVAELVRDGAVMVKRRNPGR